MTRRTEQPESPEWQTRELYEGGPTEAGPSYAWRAYDELAVEIKPVAPALARWLWWLCRFQPAARAGAALLVKHIRAESKR